MQCVPNKASCLGGVDSGSAVIDIFQRVGSISLSLLEAGSLTEAGIAWPGHSELRLRVAVVGADLEAEAVQQQLAATPPVVEATKPPSAKPSPMVGPQAEALEPWKSPAVEDLLLPALAGMEVPTPAVTHSPPQRPPAEEPEKIYKPIALNNCDRIIPYLYLGGVDAVADSQSLVDQGIRAICCCLRETEFPTREFANGIEYYRVDVEDIAREPIELFWPEATEFIHSWVSREQPVLVHCRAGVSRSASVVITYLMTYHGYSLHEAFFLVRSHRAIITPNLGFMEKLIDFEEAKRGSEATLDIGKYECWYTSPERAGVPDLRPD